MLSGATRELQRAHTAKISTCSIKEFPGVRPVKAPDDYGSQERRLEIAQVHAVTGAGLGLKRFPVGDDAACLAADIPQGSIAPDVAFRVLGVTLDRNRP
jgi:hypothetical protein